MSNSEKAGLFGSAAAPTEDAAQSTEEVVEVEDNQGADGGGEVAAKTDAETETPKVKRTRTPSKVTQITAELKALVKQLKSGTSGLKLLVDRKKALEEQILAVEIKIEEVNALGSTTDIEAKIEKLKADLVAAVVESA